MGLMIGRFGRFFERLDIWSSNSSICFEENFKLLNLSHRILSKGLTQSKIKFFSRVLIRISLPENRIILQCSTLQKFLESILYESYKQYGVYGCFPRLQNIAEFCGSFDQSIKMFKLKLS